MFLIAILVNILVLTWSVGFVGTKWIVFLMMWANIYLIIYDFDRVSALLVSPEVNFHFNQEGRLPGEKNHAPGIA